MAGRLDLTVERIHHVVHNTGRMGTTLASHNHSTQYLILSNDTSVQVNMRTKPGDPTGILQVTPRNYVQSSSEIVHFEFRPVRPFTPRMLNNQLHASSFNAYTFTGGGFGCRYWCILVIYMLESSHILNEGSAVALHARLPFSYSTDRAPQPLPILQGTFHNEQTQTLARGYWNAMMTQIQRRLSSMQPGERLAAEAQLQAMRTSAEQGAALAERRRQQDINEESEDEGSDDEDSDAEESD